VESVDPEFADSPNDSGGIDDTPEDGDSIFPIVE
jgi:hypothetical protein